MNNTLKRGNTESVTDNNQDSSFRDNFNGTIKLF